MELKAEYMKEKRQRTAALVVPPQPATPPLTAAPPLPTSHMEVAEVLLASTALPTPLAPPPVVLVPPPETLPTPPATPSLQVALPPSVPSAGRKIVAVSRSSPCCRPTLFLQRCKTRQMPCRGLRRRRASPNTVAVRGRKGAAVAPRRLPMPPTTHVTSSHIKGLLSIGGSLLLLHVT